MSINVTRKTLRIYCQCSRIFPEISCFYDPLQAVIRNFELNCIFPSTLILFASIYCKKGFPQCKENVYYHFPNFWSVYIQNAKSSEVKCNTQTFIKSKNILDLAYLDQNQTFKTPGYLIYMPFSILSIHPTIQITMKLSSLFFVN
jgi:hypothetical protein